MKQKINANKAMKIEALKDTLNLFGR